MPGWHAITEPYRKAGRIQVAGIIQEQHPERCRLFMQWKQMDFPILVDSLNLLGVKAVPITILINEQGIIQAVNPDKDAFQDFVSGSEASKPNKSPFTLPLPDWEGALSAPDTEDPSALGEAADLACLWGGEPGLDKAISLYNKALDLGHPKADLSFRLGVAYRSRFEGSNRVQGDFQRAIDAWEKALEMDPNQYIWRRRIQQYGPRLDKPYSFYDWVPSARRDILSRGETPHPLGVEPGGAEFAAPDKDWKEEPPVSGAEPDPNGRVYRDFGKWIQLETALASHTGDPERIYRVHLYLLPNGASGAHWNNEAEPLTLWIQNLPGWSIHPQKITAPNPPLAVDNQERHIEFEIRKNDPTAEDPGSLEPILKGYALYNVCEDENGVCLYRRQDFEIPLPQ